MATTVRNEKTYLTNSV
ncbi:hypothetical protein N499_0085A, partial [Wolbachia pipientis wVitA]